MDKIKFSKRQREIIIGKLLGDGHLETQTFGKTYRLKIEHSIKQKDYVEWVCDELKNCVVTAPKHKKQQVNGKSYEKCWFNTISSGLFRFYGQQFYKNGKKIVPKRIYKWLTPLALSVWFMDDGNIKSKECKGRILNTQSFDNASLKLLQSAIMKNFNIQTTLRKQKEGKQIYILAEEYEKFKETVDKYILPSMKYKLG